MAIKHFCAKFSLYDKISKHFSNANMQAIALSLAESSETSMTTMGAESSSTVKGASENTPYKNNGKTSVQDSAKNKKIKMLVLPL